MNILHVIDNLDPATGGPAAVAMRLAAGQAHLGHCLQVLSYATPLQSAAIAASFERVPGIDRIARTELPPLTRIELLLQKRARAKLHQIVPNVDWLYLHGVWNPILKTAADVSQYNRKPYFVLPHGMLDPWSLAQKRWKKRLALATGYRRMLDRATALHLLNEDERTLIGPLRLKPPAVIIPNGVFEEELALPAATPSFFEMFPSLQGRPFILFLGRLHKKKGLDLLSSAFAIIAQQDATVQLVVAGPEGNASAQFDQDIAAAGLGDRVHRIGPIYGDAKLAAYRSAACFCLPSRQEGFSLAVVEALAMGVPAVITPGVHFPEVGSAGAGEVVEPRADALAAALLRITTNAQLRERMSDAAKALIASRYTWPRIAEESLRAFERLVGPVHR